MSCKQTLYFLPGTMCDQALWNAIWKNIQPNFNCVHISIPSGESIEDIVNQIGQQLPCNPVNLIGFSLGGYLAAALAIEMPEKVERLQILSNCPMPLPQEELRQRKNTLAWLNKFEYQGMPLAKIKQLLHSQHHQKKDIIKNISEMEKRLGMASLINQLTATSQRLDMFDYLKDLPIPIKFSFGDMDNLVNKGTMIEKAKLSNNWQMEIINKCGHMLPLEQPERLANSIQQWFTNE